MAPTYSHHAITSGLKLKLPSLTTSLQLLFALGLVWLIVTNSLAAYLGNVGPGFDFWLTREEPNALLNAADQEINFGAEASDTSSDAGSAGSPVTQTSETKSPSAANSFPPQVRADARQLAAAALVMDPLNARALRILGQVAGSDEDAERFMNAAVSRSIQESLAVYWLMHDSFVRKQYAQTAHYADILLRSRPQLSPFVVPTLVSMAENQDAKPEIDKLLVTNPPWLHGFFIEILSSVSDARTPLELMLAAKNGGIAPTPADLQNYMLFLMHNHLYELAYYAWLQFLPAEQLSTMGLLFNGNFQFPLSGQVFDWDLRSGDGVRIEVEPEQNNPGRRALHLEFLGREVGDYSVAQMLTLAPGAYRLTGRQMGELVGARGVRWRVSCFHDPGMLQVGEGPMFTGKSDWVTFDVPFTVPSGGCRAQEVRAELDARSASEELVTGNVWFDGLQIERVNSPGDREKN